MESLEYNQGRSNQSSSCESDCNSIVANTGKGKSGRKAVSPRRRRKTENPKTMTSTSAVAEEDRREKIIQQKFIELSSILPQLNKKNEDLMLEDAISYMKLLQERAQILEKCKTKKKKKKKKNMCVEKAWVFGDTDTISSSIHPAKQALVEIKARSQEKDVLIGVHCENQKGFLTKVVGEIEKLHLNVEKVAAFPFGDSFMDITVTAKMGEESFMTMKDLKRDLRKALL